jgi:hypothetical protein
LGSKSTRFVCQGKEAVVAICAHPHRNHIRAVLALECVGPLGAWLLVGAPEARGHVVRVLRVWGNPKHLPPGVFCWGWS